MHRFKKRISFCSVIISMGFISVEAYTNARVHAMSAVGKGLVWVKMRDIQDGLRIKNMSDLARKEIQGIH